MAEGEEVEVKRPGWLFIPVIILILGLFGAVAWVYFSEYDRLSNENVRAFIAGFGAWAPVIYALIYTISAPIPYMTVVLSPVGGLLFGAFWGSLLVIGIATLSSLIPFTLARQLGQGWVESKLKGKRLDDIYQRSQGQNGFLFIFLMRLIPVMPWEVQNYIAGLSKIPLTTYLIATPLGIIPGSVGLVLLGDAITDPTSWRFVLAVALNVVVAVITPLVATLVYRRKRRRGNGGVETPE